VSAVAGQLGHLLCFVVAGTGLDTQSNPAGPHDVDHPQRTHVHHRTHQLPRLTDYWPQQPSGQQAERQQRRRGGGPAPESPESPESPELPGLQIGQMPAAARVTRRHTNPGLTGKQIGQVMGDNPRRYFTRSVS
jgi:hypothetical protein